MKTIPYCLFSDRTNGRFIAIFNPIRRFWAQGGRQVGRELARESLLAIQQSAASLAASYQCAKDLYDSKQQEFKQAEQQAILAYERGNKKAGNLAMGKAIAIKLILLQLAEQLRQAEQMLKKDRKLMLLVKDRKHRSEQENEQVGLSR